MSEKAWVGGVTSSSLVLHLRLHFHQLWDLGCFGFVFLHISKIFYFYRLKYQEWQFLIYLKFGMKWPHLSSSFTNFIIVIESALKNWKGLETTCRIAVNLYTKLITLKFCYCCSVIFSDRFLCTVIIHMHTVISVCENFVIFHKPSSSVPYSFHLII